MVVTAVPRNCATAIFSVLRQAHGYKGGRRFEDRIASCAAQRVRKHSHNVKIVKILTYTGCPRRNGQNFGRVFLILNYTDITQNTYVQS